VSTALGLRITDLVANGGPNGRSDTGFEVKVNKSPYTLKQQMKDASIATKGGTVQSRTSANFPYGSRVQYPTGVIFVFDEIE
jgi:ribosome-associated translation inhibitor RaiA